MKMEFTKCAGWVDENGLELVSHGTEAFPAACYNENLKKLPVHWHWHEELEVVIISQGSAVFSVGGQQEIINEGEGLFINSGAVHGAWLNGEGECHLRSIVFHPKLIYGCDDSIFKLKYLDPILHSPLKGLHLSKGEQWQTDMIAAIDRAWHSCSGGGFGYEFKVRAELSELSALMAQNLNLEWDEKSEQLNKYSERVKIMVSYIEKNYSQNLTLDMIAATAAVSKSECLRCFHNTLGIPPIQYLKAYRIKKAAQLIKTTNLKIGVIGEHCGFHDMSYFAITFNRYYGCTPKEYRIQE